MNLINSPIVETNNEIEQKIIAIALNDENKILEILSSLKAMDFLNPDNRLIYREMLDLFETTSNCDVSILIARLQQKEDMLSESAPLIVTKILNLYTHSIDLNKYIEIVKMYSIMNQLKKFGSNLSDKTLEFDKFDEQLWTMQKEFLDIVNSKSQLNLLSSDEMTRSYIQLLTTIKQNSNRITGTPSGFHAIDEFTNGFQAGDLIILAARPSIGKTALALNFLLAAAKECKDDECVVMFSLEMSAHQLMERFISSEVGINSKVLKTGTWTDDEEFFIDDCIYKIKKLPIIIDESSNATILEIQTKLKKIAATKKIKLVVVDYLQLVQGSSKAGINRQQEVSQISRTLKSIARDLLTPIIAVAQLSRKIEERKGVDKKPILSDLRESGSIEQDADLVTFINYEKGETDLNASNDNIKKYSNIVIVDFIIAKHRNGATGEIKLLFERSFGKYSSYQQ